MSVSTEIAYHKAREQVCRDSAARSEASNSADRHVALADLHARMWNELECGMRDAARCSTLSGIDKALPGLHRRDGSTLR